MKRCLAVLLALLCAVCLPVPARADGALDAVLEAAEIAAPALSAAEAANILRARQAAGDDGGAVAYADYDLTQNGVLDDTDVQAALWAASGQIPDLVKFVERISTGLLGEVEFQRFRYGDPFEDGMGNYYSDAVSVTVTKGEAHDAVYFIADIYLQDLACLATATPVTQHGDGGYVTGMAKAVNAVIAINGDYYTQRKEGPIIRNGEQVIAGVTKRWDIGLLTREGALLTYPAGELTKAALSELNVYQSWVFGPALLDPDGKAYPDIVSEVFNKNPRAAIGYYGLGHYCFILVDGRQTGYSVGLNLRRLAELCQELGLRSAYNLDGGQSAEMATRETLINKPYSGGRPVSDIVYIREVPEELCY